MGPKYWVNKMGLESRDERKQWCVSYTSWRASSVKVLKTRSACDFKCVSVGLSSKYFNNDPGARALAPHANQSIFVGEMLKFLSGM